MIYEVKYKGHAIDPKDIENIWSVLFGEEILRDIEGYKVEKEEK